MIGSSDDRRPTATPDELALLLADPHARAVFCAIALGASGAADIVERSRLDARSAALAIGQLTARGVVAPLGVGRLRVDEASLETAAQIATARVHREAVRSQPDPDLRGFIRAGVLVKLPDPADITRVGHIYGHLVGTTFEEGRDFDEQTVTARLQPWCAGGVLDVVALRRQLIDLGFLSRADGRYRVVAAADR